MLSKKFIITYRLVGMTFNQSREVFADTEYEALDTFKMVMPLSKDCYTIVSVREV